MPHAKYLAFFGQNATEMPKPYQSDTAKLTNSVTQNTALTD